MPGKFLLNFTPTGMIPTKAMTPEVPIHPAEIVAQVREAVTLGANMAHLHARDPVDGRPTYRPEVYAEIVSGVRLHHPDLVICLSTSGRDFPGFAERAACLDLSGDLKPDMASLTLSSLNFNNQASMNSPDMIKALAARMQERGIKPELEAFDLGMINYAHYLISKGLITPPYYFNLILGNIACAQATLLSLGLMIRELPPDSYWSVGGIGGAQLRMNIIGIADGGGVRVGLEDNIYWDTERTRLASNGELVERLVTIARALGCVPYSLSEARTLLALPT
ncbi:MAG TPA: 3-keto-5-aminohexanoate cleavage protein [Gemmatimonadales bacterium]|nr:3-keto-5-aminohexanoate cleavage protein [Gemmatimonadales bacterium]